MPQTPYSSLVGSTGRGVEVTTDHFGANCVATVNFALESGPYNTAIEALGVTHLRYPGGTVTEELLGPSHEHWNQMLNSQEDYITLEDGSRVQTLHSILEYAAGTDASVTFVLPTAAFLSDGPTGDREPNYAEIDNLISDFCDALRSNPNSAQISCIEIGNEYYYQGRMTAEEYGDLANYMVQRVNVSMQLLESNIGDSTGFVAPDIAVQSGAGWQPGDNETILDLLDDSAKQAISAVVTHYYPRTHDTVGNFDRHLNELDDWRDDPAFGDLRFFASEWNIQNSDSSDNGMLHAGALVAAFEEMLLEGIDVASIWGTQYRSLDTRLSTLSHRDSGDANATNIDTDLTAAGEVFSIMSRSLVGLRPLDIDYSQYIRTPIDYSDRDDDLRVTDFGSDDRYVAFISNRSLSENLRLDISLEDFFGSSGHVSIRVISPTDDPATTRVDESDPSLHRTEPDLDFLYSGSLAGLPDEIIIPEGSIAIVEVTLGNEGVFLSGQDSMSDEAFINYHDSITGSTHADTLLGQSGDDTLSGDSGRDLLVGGGGSDSLTGGNDSDVVAGGAGNDRLQGDVAGDVLLDDTGDDTSVGGSGNDVFLDGAGADFLSGEEGSDVFLVADGSNTVVGGSGSDLLFIDGSTETAFVDFDVGSGDQIDLSSYFDDEGALRASLEGAVNEWTEGQLLQLELSESTSLQIAYTGENIDDLIGGFLVGSESTIVQSLAQTLEPLSFDQISAVSGEYSGRLSGIGEDGRAQIELLEQLSPDAAAAYLIGLDPSEIHALADALGSDGIFSRVTSLSDETVLRIAGTASPDQLEALLHGLPDESLAAWYSSMPSVLRDTFSESLEGTNIARPVDDLDFDDGEGEIQDPDDEDGVGVEPTPVETPENPNNSDDEEDDPDSDDNFVDGDCFISTVAFGNPEHPTVWLLRWYRDMILRRSAMGRLCVAVYWSIGPSLARVIAQSLLMRAICQATFLLIGYVIAWGYSRSVGKQSDHIAWPENRSMVFRITRKCRRTKWK